MRGGNAPRSVGTTVKGPPIQAIVAPYVEMLTGVHQVLEYRQSGRVYPSDEGSLPTLHNESWHINRCIIITLVGCTEHSQSSYCHL